MTGNDITARLKHDRARMTGFAFATADALIEIDDDSRITWAGGALQSIFRKSLGDLTGQELRRELTPAAAGQLDVAMKRVRQGGRVRDVELALAMWNGQTRPAVTVAIHRPLEIADSKYYVSAVLSKQPASAATAVLPRDNLTGLLELSGFVDLARTSVRRAQENGLTPNLTLIEMIPAGQLAALIGQDRATGLLHDMGNELRQYSLGHEAASAIGDGKFGIAHLESDGISGLKSSMAQLCEAYELDGKALQFDAKTIDFGSAVLGEDDISSILTFVCDKFRDEGLRRVEAISATAYLEKITEDVVSRILSMRDIIREQRLNLVFQPIIRIASGALHHYEVLLRFEDGRSPFEDIVFAESVNIIHELDLAIIQRALGRMDEMERQGHKVSFAVNMSARSLLNERFMQMFNETAANHTQGRQRLIVEVTESTKIDDLEGAARMVNHLRRMGHPVCLDDFGAGSASLQYLQALDVDYVKIDGRYIRGLVEERKQRAIVLGILRTCGELKVATVAEMVETREQHQLLRDFGVEYGQGWYYGRPAPDFVTPKAVIAWGTVNRE
jgi:EAL domain-containing protein (putative c-di-GMP-specific phosphodiesterase class I)/PAS domain-containing protein